MPSVTTSNLTDRSLVMIVRNIRYLAFDIDKWLEQNVWYVNPVYSSQNRRFELFCGMFGRKCTIPVYVLVEHALDTWRNNRLTVRLVVVGQDKTGDEYELCLLEKEFSIGEVVSNEFLENILKIMLTIRDNPRETERAVKTKDITLLIKDLT